MAVESHGAHINVALRLRVGCLLIPLVVCEYEDPQLRALARLAMVVRARPEMKFECLVVVKFVSVRSRFLSTESDRPPPSP